MPCSRYFFIVNPKSGSSVNATKVRRLRDALCRRGGSVRLALTRSLAHARDLAAEATHGDYDTLVVAGGDGTVNSVAQGLAGSATPVLLVPTGTENLLARELGLDGSLETSLAALENGQLHNLDLGRANGTYFVVVAGVGFDGEVIQRINRFRSGHITHTDYIWPICRTFWEHRFPRLRVVADGEEVCHDRALVFVSNVRRYAVGLRVAPQADFSDGHLDLTVYKTSSRKRLLLHAGLTVANLSHLRQDVIRRRCRRITVACTQGRAAVEFDGDPGPDAPLDFEVVPAAARILSPPPASGPRSMIPHFYRLKQWLGR